MPSWKKKKGTEMCITLRVITGIIAARVIRKRKIEEVVRSFPLRACRRSDSADSD